MADDTNHRSFRSHDPHSRDAAHASADSSNDPLAELARLIGQTDPFAEFGHENARRAPAQRHDEALQPAYQTAVAGAEQGRRASAAAAPERYSYSPVAGDPHAAARSHDQQQQSAPGYGQSDRAGPGDGGGYDADPYDDEQMQAPTGDDNYYGEVAAPRRRGGIIAIACVFALAVIGTAGAFGYRTMFGASASNAPPPVIKADTTPSKVVPSPSEAKKTTGKVIYDRVGDQTQTEKLVPREETPVGIKDKPEGVIAPTQTASAGGDALQAFAGDPASTEPKKIHTIVIRPDQPGMGLPPPSSPAAPATAAASPASPSPASTASAAQPPAPATESRVTSAQPQAAPEAAPPRHVSPPHRAEPAVRHAQAAPPRNAPLSLSPNANAALPPPPKQATRVASAPAARTAAPAASTARGAHGGYVQVSAQRSEADAQASFHFLQGKYPKQLGGRQVVIHRADLGSKGVYYRALVGPFASTSEAAKLCGSLKTAGGSCLIQRN